MAKKSKKASGRPPREVWLVLVDGHAARALGSRRDARAVTSDIAKGHVYVGEGEVTIAGPYLLAERVGNR